MRKTATLPSASRPLAASSSDLALPCPSTSSDTHSHPISSALTTRLALYRSVLIANFGAFLVGLHFALFSGILEMQHFAKTLGKHVDQVLPLSVSSLTKSLVTAAYILSMALTAPFCGPLIDHLGRRPSLHAIAILFAISSIATLYARSVLHLILMRLLAGLAYAIAIVAIPLYTAELAPAASRASLVNLYPIMLGLGIFFAQLCNIFLAHAAWTDPVALSIFPALLMLFGVFTGAPESPVWITARQQAATDSTPQPILPLTNTNNDSDDEINIIHDYEDDDDDNDHEKGESKDNKNRTEINSNRTEILNMSAPNSQLASIRKLHGPTSLLDVLRDPPSRRRLCIGIGLSIVQQLSGINAVFFYAPAIVNDVLQWKGNDASLWAAAAVGGANLLSCLVASSVVELTGRRTLLLMGAPPMALSLVTIGAMREGFIPKHGLLGVSCLLIYVASFSLTYGPVSIVVSSEIFPPRISGTCFSVCMGVFGLFSTAVGMAFLFVMKAIGGGVFFIFALCLGLSSLFVYYYVPETKGLTLQEIEELLDGPTTSR